MAQGRLANIQPLPLLALCFDDQVHVRMRFVRMQNERIPVLESKLIHGELAHGRQHFLCGTCPAASKR